MRYNSAGEKFPWGLTDTKRPSSVVERGWRPSTAPIKEAIVGNWRDVRVSSSAFKDRRGPFWVRTPSRKFFTCQDCIKFFFNILSKKLLSKSLYYSVLPISQRIQLAPAGVSANRHRRVLLNYNLTIPKITFRYVKLISGYLVAEFGERSQETLYLFKFKKT